MLIDLDLDHRDDIDLALVRWDLHTHQRAHSAKARRDVIGHLVEFKQTITLLLAHQVTISV